MIFSKLVPLVINIKRIFNQIIFNCTRVRRNRWCYKNQNPGSKK